MFLVFALALSHILIFVFVFSLSLSLSLSLSGFYSCEVCEPFLGCVKVTFFFLKNSVACVKVTFIVFHLAFCARQEFCYGASSMNLIRQCLATPFVWFVVAICILFLSQICVSNGLPVLYCPVSKAVVTTSHLFVTGFVLSCFKSVYNNFAFVRLRSQSLC